MANACANHIIIKTSVSPVQFLTVVPEEHTNEYIFELQESIMPFSSKTNSIAWWTKWFTCDDCKLTDTITTTAPPEPTPIIITQWTRRYPVLQRMPFVPYTYNVWDISGDSAWGPPLGYLETLYKLLKKIDDRTTIDCWYYEPGTGFLGHWHNRMDQQEETPLTFWSDTLEKDVVYSVDAFQAGVLSHFQDPDETLSYEEALEQLTTREDLREITEYFEESISKQVQ